MDHLQRYLPDFVTPLNPAHIFVNHPVALPQFLRALNADNFGELSFTTATTFTLIAIAEIGDKSQLMCMTMASRHRAMPVFLGAVSAFALLNLLAVIFGVAIANWLPEYLVAAIVAFLFAAFGIHALRIDAEDDDDIEKNDNGHSIFLSAFLLITVAEFGDKTQLASVALSSSAPAAAVWLGSTAALASTSALGIMAGRTIMQKIPLKLLHKISGIFFLTLSIFAVYRTFICYIN